MAKKVQSPNGPDARIASLLDTFHAVERDLRVLAPAEGEGREAEFVASTEEVASDGLIVLADAWQLERFLKSGAFLWAHGTQDLPIGAPVSAAIDAQARCLRVRVRFAKAEDNPKADSVYRLYRDGILRAVSVGFRILEMRKAIPAEAERGAWGVVTKAELYEVSAVPVPADSGALVASIRERLAAGALTGSDADALDFLGASDEAGPHAGAWREAAAVCRAFTPPAASPPAPPPPEPTANVGSGSAEPTARRARVPENCAALRDLARNASQMGSMLDAIAGDIEAEEPEDDEEAPPPPTEAEKALAAEVERLTAENQSLRAQVEELRLARAIDDVRRAVRGNPA